MAAPPPEDRGSSPLVACGYTHPGLRREDDEDAFGCFPDERLFVVADGMGGRAAGAEAARLAVDEFEKFFRSFHANPRQAWPFPVDRSLSLGANLLRVGIQVANRAIRQAAMSDAARGRMGATIIALAVGDSRINVAHVGDARLYRVRDGILKRLTRDHSVVEEMLAARPELTAEEVARVAPQNVVTRALGTRDDVSPTVYINTFTEGDLYLLCTDGLWSVVADDTIAAALAATTDLEAAGQYLLDAANEAGGPDNITALLVRT